MKRLKLLVGALAISMMLLMPSVSSAYPIYPSEVSAPWSDLAVKINPSTFDFIQTLVNDLFEYDDLLDTDTYSDALVLVNEMVFNGDDPLMATDAALFSTCMTNITIIGSICIGAFITDTDNDGFVLDWGGRDLTDPLTGDVPSVTIAGSRGPLWKTYEDDSLEINVLFDYLKIELLLDEPSQAGEISFAFPDGSTDTCWHYRAPAGLGWNEITDTCTAVGLGAIMPPGNAITNSRNNALQDIASPDDVEAAGCPVEWAEDSDMIAGMCSRSGEDGWVDANGTVWPFPRDNAICDFYAPECDLSTWVWLNGNVWIGTNPAVGDNYDVQLSLGIRLLLDGSTTPDYANSSVAIELQGLDFGGVIQVDLIEAAGPNHPQFQISEDVDALIPNVTAAFRLFIDDVFKCADLSDSEALDPNCIGYFVGPTPIYNLRDLLASLLPTAILFPLIPMEDFMGEYTQPGIDIDLAMQSGMMAEEDFGVMLAGNLVLDIMLQRAYAQDDPAEVFEAGERVLVGATDWAYTWPSCAIGSNGAVGVWGYTAAGTLNATGPYYPNPGPAVTPPSPADTTAVIQDPPPNWDCPTSEGLAIDGSACSSWDVSVSNPYIDRHGEGPIILGTQQADRMAEGYALGGSETTSHPYGMAGYDLGIALHQNVLSKVIYDAVASGILCIDLDPANPTSATDTSTYGMITGLLFDYLNTGSQLLGDEFGLTDIILPEEPTTGWGGAACADGDDPIRLMIVPWLVDPRSGTAWAGHRPRAWTGGLVTDVIGVGALTDITDWPASPSPWDYNPVTAPIDYLNAQGTAEADLIFDIPHLMLEFYVWSDASDCAQEDPWDRGYQTIQRVISIDLGLKLALDIEIVNTPTTMTMPEGTETSSVWARTYHIGIIGDPQIKNVYTYAESGVAHHPANVGGCADGSGEPGSCSGGVYDGYTVGNAENMMGNLLTTLLDLVIQLDLNLTLDLSAIDVGGDGLGGEAADPDDQLQLAVDGLIAASAPDKDEDESGWDGDNRGDYLEIFLRLVGTIPPGLIMNMIEDALSGGISLGAPRTYSYFDQGTVLPPETTFVNAPSVVNGFEAIFSFAGKDESTKASDLRYSWRLDHTPWRPFTKSTMAYTRGLINGKHTIEVKAIDKDGNVEATPAKFEFVSDTAGPRITLKGEEMSVTGRSPVFYAESFDYVFKSDIKTYYSVDGGNWTETSGEIELSSLGDGGHVLSVKALDPAGNEKVVTHEFVVDADAGYGCSTASGGNGSMLAFLLMLAPLAMLVIRRKTA